MFKGINLTDYLYELRKDAKSAFFSVSAFASVKIYLSVSALLNILIWLSARFIKKATGTEQIALHYNVDFGIDYYDDAGKIFIIPVLGLIIVLFNYFVAMLVSQNKDAVMIFHILFASALLVNVVLLAAIVSVYLINFR